jgi:hypothetical protein
MTIGTMETVPLVSALAVAYAEKPPAKSKKKAPINGGKRIGIPTLRQ